MGTRSVMYDQTANYGPGYHPPSRVGKEPIYDSSYDRSVVPDKRYDHRASNDLYGSAARDGRHVVPHSHTGTTTANPDPYLLTSQNNYINNRPSDSKMLVNVGGVRHEILYTTLAKFPQTRLGLLKECRTEDAILNYCDYYSYDDNEYFFDKNSRVFACIISCYRTGKLHIPDEICLSELVTELRYWGFDESFLDMCCSQKYRMRKLLYQEMRAEAENEILQMYGYQYQVFDDRFGVGPCAPYRKFLYDSYENPRIAKTTKVLPVISIIFSITAVVAVALHSVESIRDSSTDGSGKVIENVIISRILMVCVTWIAIEYVLRLFSSPAVTRFLFDGCNIIDLLGCGLYFYTLLQSNKLPDRLTDLWRLYLMLRSWKVPNQICKLLYDPAVLRMDSAILTNFNKQFGILMLFFLTGVLMFSTAIYTAEKDDPESPFTSIPETFWFTIATLTTAGNTSVHPNTPWGKYFGALCSIVGVLFLASVITISNFARVLQNISSNQLQQQQQSGIIPNYGPSIGMQTPAGTRPQQPPDLSAGRTPTSQSRSTSEEMTSFHHITFNDDLMNALGTIDVLVERDRKPVRDPMSHTNNKVKTISLKIKLDPPKGFGAVPSATGIGSKLTTTQTTSGTGVPQSFLNQTTSGAAAKIMSSITGANNRTYPPAMV